MKVREATPAIGETGRSSYPDGAQVPGDRQGEDAHEEVSQTVSGQAKGDHKKDRRKKNAAERRQQKARAQARFTGMLVSMVQALHHRGAQAGAGLEAIVRMVSSPRPSEVPSPTRLVSPPTKPEEGEAESHAEGGE